MIEQSSYFKYRSGSHYSSTPKHQMLNKFPYHTHQTYSFYYSPNLQSLTHFISHNSRLKVLPTNINLNLKLLSTSSMIAKTILIDTNYPIIRPRSAVIQYRTATAQNLNSHQLDWHSININIMRNSRKIALSEFIRLGPLNTPPPHNIF